MFSKTTWRKDKGEALKIPEFLSSTNEVSAQRRPYSYLEEVERLIPKDPLLKKCISKQLEKKIQNQKGMKTQYSQQFISYSKMTMDMSQSL